MSFFVNNVTDKHYVGGMLDQTARWGNKVAITGLWNRDADRYAGVRLHYRF